MAVVVYRIIPERVIPRNLYHVHCFIWSLLVLPAFCFGRISFTPSFRRSIKCVSANSTTCKVRNKMRKYFAAYTISALVTDWFDIYIHITYLVTWSISRFRLMTRFASILQLVTVSGLVKLLAFNAHIYPSKYLVYF